MNENNITVLTNPVQMQDVMELDIRDLLAQLLLKWKKILSFILAGAILACGIALLKNNIEKKPVTDEKIAKARAMVATDKAAMVDDLLFQYISYKELQEKTRAYYSNFASSNVNPENTVQMRSQFYITSFIKDLDTVFIKMAVTEADYDAMRDIAPDVEAGATIYDRIIFSTAYNEKPNTSNTISNTINNINIPVQDGEENAYLINVELYGNSEEQCRKMMEIIETAFQRETEEMKVLDPEIKLKVLGEQFDYDVTEYVQTLNKKNIDRMSTSEYEMNNLKNQVNTLSSEEKKYYDLIMERYEETFAVKEHVSWIKWTLIGALLGATIAVCVIFLGYVLDGKVKAPCELEQSGRVLNRVFVKGKQNLFGKWMAGLICADDINPSVKADMVATDVSIVMKKNEKSNVMLLCNKEDEDAMNFADQVKGSLLAKNSGLMVSIGNPMCSVEELEMAAQADVGVVFAEMKKSKRTVLREWRQICSQYKLPLAGSVSVQRCW